MERIISFSVWGTDRLYLDGLFANLKLIPDIYPGWTPRVYVDPHVANYDLAEIIRLGAQVEIVDNNRGKWYGLFWRFFPASDSTIERFISRDADSRVNVREKAAVDEWIASCKPFHVMRDHKNHDVPVLGGMWGCRGGYIPGIKRRIDNWKDTDNKGCDQKFLARVIWPEVMSEHIGHDEFYPHRFGGPSARKFPKHSQFDGKHVGEIIK